jgi:Ni/Co efflux regulator RcnB
MVYAFYPSGYAANATNPRFVNSMGGDQGGAKTGQDYYRKKEQTNKDYYREILKRPSRNGTRWA